MMHASDRTKQRPSESSAPQEFPITGGASAGQFGSRQRPELTGTCGFNSCRPNLRYDLATRTPPTAESAHHAERRLLRLFGKRVWMPSRRAIPDGEYVLRFANLGYPDGACKQHGLSGTTRQ